MLSRKRHKKFAWILLLGLVLPAFSFADQVVDLKVLVISTGTPAEDAGLDLIDDMLDQIGVPYDVLDAKREQLTADKLAAGDHGYYNGIILTNAELFIPGVGSGFTLSEWQALFDYERTFSVRESVISGFPATNPSLGLNYGMTNITASSNITAVWQPPAGGDELYEYINTANPFLITDFAFMADPLYPAGGALPPPGSGAPVVQPLLVDQATGKTLVSKLSYEDGREVLLSTITNAWYLIHSQLLNYEFLNFASKGVFIGARKVYLATHLDDLFLGDDIWNPVTKQTDLPPYRNTAADFSDAVAAQQAFVAAHPTISAFKLDFAFNGSGAGMPLQTARDNFRTRSYDNNDGDLDWVSSWIEDDVYGGGARKGQVRIKKGKLVLDDYPDTGTDPSIERVVNLLGATQATLSFKFETTKGVDRDDAVVVEVSPDGVNWTILEEFTGIRGKVKRNRSYDITAYASEETHIRFRVSNKYGGKKEAFKVAYVAVSREKQDPLTDAVIANQSHFRFINHTYSHPDMDASAGMTYDQLREEIVKNQDVWQLLGLPEYFENLNTIVTGNHSGLEDKMGTENDPSDDLPYPAGMNTTLMQVLEDLNFEFLASDTSRQNQGIESYVPGFDLLLLPRYPANLFYNVTTPENWMDEYNYIFYERYIEMGQDPCTIPGAICQPRNYAEILQAEAETALRHMLTYTPRPHFFHISNLHEYSAGKFLIFDWLESVVSQYEQLMTLPIINLPYYQIGQLSKERLQARSSNVQGQWNLANNTLIFSANGDAVIDVTGVKGGELYGGQRLGRLRVGPVPITVDVDRAVDDNNSGGGSGALVGEYRDDFEVESYDNNDGTLSWAGPWIEDDIYGQGPDGGQVDIEGGMLILEDRPNTGTEPSVTRTFDLSGANTAILSFDFQTTRGVDRSDAVTIEISTDGANWTVLEEITGVRGSTYESRSYDISAFASPQTQIRFRVSKHYGGKNEMFMVEYVEVSVNAPSSSAN